MIDLLFQKSFSEAARFYKCVIALRSPSPAGQGLLKEGYAAKSFAIKAKSSMNGPTAGFVACDPVFVKGDPSGQIKQRQQIALALSGGARVVPLVISPQRIKWLIKSGMASQSGPGRLQARIHKISKTFILKPGGVDAAGMWRVCYPDGSPLEVLANPLHVTGPLDYRRAVTADYDLFGIFPRRQQAVNVKPLEPVARVLKSHSVVHKRAANTYLDSIRRASGQPQCAEAGNISPFSRTVIRRVNANIAGEGYRGGDLVQHGAENANPFSDGQDFPLLFFFPRGDRIMIHENDGLTKIIAEMASRGYATNMNPAFTIQRP